MPAESIIEKNLNPQHKLTNLDISTHYSEKSFWIFKKDLTAALAYWIIKQSPYDTPNVTEAVEAYDKFLSPLFDKEVIKISYQRLKEEFVNAQIFESIPEILIFNTPKIDTGCEFMIVSRYEHPKPDYDFIGITALAHNIYYMIMREKITQDY